MLLEDLREGLVIDGQVELLPKHPGILGENAMKLRSLLQLVFRLEEQHLETLEEIKPVRDQLARVDDRGEACALKKFRELLLFFPRQPEDVREDLLQRGGTFFERVTQQVEREAPASGVALVEVGKVRVDVQSQHVEDLPL